MEMNNEDIGKKISEETVLYAARKIAAEYTLTGKSVPGKAALIQLAKQRIATCEMTEGALI